MHFPLAHTLLALATILRAVAEDNPIAPTSLDASATPTSGGDNTGATAETATTTGTGGGGGGGGAGGGPPGLPPYAPENYSYPQPPIPSVTAVLPTSFSLDPDFVITDQPTVREFTFDIATAAGSPSGFLRSMMVVNNQFPGPLIEVNEGDTVIVHVNNHLDIGQALHWHGISQNGTNWADGVSGISQCPIPPGASFTYKFTVNNQFGTFWWHAHHSNTMADGIVGAFIVHSVNDPVKRGQDFDEEHLLYLSDWMNDQSQVIVDALYSLEGYRGAQIPPPVDAVLFNGVGQTNCSVAQKGVPCSTNAPSEVVVEKGKRIRLRVINSGTHALYRFSIDNHVLNVVEVDDTEIKTLSVHEVPISPGQRLSIIVNTDQEGDAFWMRAGVGMHCIARQEPMVGLGVLRYDHGTAATKYRRSATDNSNQTPSQLPTTQPWGDLEIPDAPCMDIDNLHSVVPLIPENPPATPDGAHVFNSSFGQFFDPIDFANFSGFAFNGVPYFNKIFDPVLAQVQRGQDLNGSLFAHTIFPTLGAYDIIVNQLDNGVAHPFHLHGRKFHIVARGLGNITCLADAQANAAAGNGFVNFDNPLRRDTLFIPETSYAILRLVTDTPGVWPLHCHVGWHLSKGKLAMIIVRPDTVMKDVNGDGWSDLCYGTDPNAWGPQKRRFGRFMPPQARKRVFRAVNGA